VKKKILFQDGKVSSLYDDTLSQKLLEKLGGEAAITRASHVEAAPGRKPTIEFHVDLSPCQGPTLTGFKTYKEAVDAEIDWLHKNKLAVNT
jgi:hypothetical protein